MPLTPIPRRRRRRRRRRPLVAGFLVVAIAAGLGAWLLARGSSAGSDTVGKVAHRTAARAVGPVRLREQSLSSLGSPVQDAAAVALDGSRTLVLGGLTAADTSRTDIRIVSAGSDRKVGGLPVGLHDTAAVKLGTSVYVFGGGTATNTQSDQVLRVPASGGSATVVGRLPAPSSDQSAAGIGGMAYVVGGYTGSRWLDTIVAWRPGAPARVVAHLPVPIRYAAVAAAEGELVIAGGSLPAGTASDAVLVYRPGASRVIRIGRLPAPATHAAAAALGETVFVIGGRGAALDSPTARIVSIDPRTARVREAGRLSSPRSDLAAVSLGGRILLAGGHGTTGTQSTISELVQAAQRTPTRRGTRTAPARNVYAFDGVNMLIGAARR